MFLVPKKVMGSPRTDSLSYFVELVTEPRSSGNAVRVLNHSLRRGVSAVPVVTFGLALQIPLASVFLVLGATTPSLIISSLDKDFYISNHGSWKHP